ncbi:MAG TPA: polymer-forming cytoskeletal protein [Acidimicrobiia bacterium]|nr:polymer-forming cytoskeletal protein [Acidimicrobiia bacterium]
MIRRSVGVLLLGASVAASCVAGAAPAGATRTGTQPRDRDDTQVVVTGRVVVAPDERVGDVVILNGDARINGRVDGSVFALNGDVVVRGSVKDDVTAFNGRVTVAGGARVGGDVTSRETARISAGATVDGDVKSVGRRFALGQVGVVAVVLLWLAVGLSTLVFGMLLLLIAPRAADAFADAGRTAVGASIGLGIAAAIGIPIAGLILLATVVGLPLGAVILLTLGFLYMLGYVASAYFLGRVILRPPRNRFLAYLVGWAILTVAGVIPVLNVIMLIAATVYGLGTIVVATFRARSGPREPAPADTGRTEPAPAG